MTGERDVLDRAVDPSGYIREAALVELAGEPRPAAIRILLGRANDWVPQVRAAATVALAAHLRDDFVPAWALALDTVDALRRAGRVDGGAVLAPIDAFLAVPERLARVVEATRTAPVALQRLVGAMRRASAADDTTLATLLGDDAGGADIVAALSATRAAETLRAAALRDRVWRAATASPHAAVRRVGLARALAAGGESHAALVERFAFDPSLTVRGRALAASSELERDAIRAAAARLLDAPWPSAATVEDRRRAIALHTRIALGDLDADATSRWLRASGARTREMAYAACWQRCDAAGREALVAAAFADAAPRVQRWAARAVERAGLVPHWRGLLDVVAQSPSPQRVAAVRRALRCASPWWRLAFELALGDATGTVDRGRLAAWCLTADGAFVAPPKADVAAIAAAWQRASSTIDAPLAAAVRSRLVRYGVIAD
jgi:hypothetical protein